MQKFNNVKNTQIVLTFSINSSTQLNMSTFKNITFIFRLILPPHERITDPQEYSLPFVNP